MEYTYIYKEEFSPHVHHITATSSVAQCYKALEPVLIFTILDKL